jgi:Na+-translocating ferredoxin:NAD+ oxidoreductase RnfD subunit
MLAFLAVAAAAATLTWLLGWWGVAVAALIAGVLLRRRRGAAWLIALAAVVGWSALIVVDTIGGRFSTLAASISGVMRVPAPALLVVTLLFGALLAWSAAVVGSEAGRLARARPPSA